MFIVDLCKALDQHKVHYGIAGGYAVALHGALRGTVDIDLVLQLSQAQFEGAVKALESLNLKSTLPLTAKQVIQFRTEYIENRNLIAWSFSNPKNPTQIVDIIITHDLKKMKIVKKDIGNYKLKVIGLDDLIAMKKQSGRPQDLADIKALIRIKSEKT